MALRVYVRWKTSYKGEIKIAMILMILKTLKVIRRFVAQQRGFLVDGVGQIACSVILHINHDILSL